MTKNSSHHAAKPAAHKPARSDKAEAEKEMEQLEQAIEAEIATEGGLGAGDDDSMAG